MLGQIDLNIKIKLGKPELFLCKPNRSKVAKLNTAYDVEQLLKLGSINELSFNLPYEITKLDNVKRNSHADLIRDKYLIQFKYRSYSEWYVVKKPVDSMEEDSDYKSIQCFSLAYELADKRVRRYKVTSYNAKQMLNDVLKNTLWRLDYVDSDFLTKFRQLDVSSSTVLDVLYQVCSIFEAVPIFDTDNRKISLYKLENIGQNRGLRISYGKYLQSMNKTLASDEIITRLHAFGSEDTSIQRVNKSGTTYVENFSYFMQGFSQDDQGNVISHSPHMSDELCIALINYNSFLDSKDGEFDTLLSQKETLQEQLTTKNNELDTLETELQIIEDQLSVANASGQPTGSLITQKNNKVAEIDVKQSEIDSIVSDIDNIDNQITTLRNSIKIENHLSDELLIELNPFIIEDEFVNTSYTKDTDLYEAVKKQIAIVSQPKINIEMDIVNFLDMITETRNHNKLNLGDTITVIQEKLNTNVEAKLLEIKFSFESGDVGVVVSNVKDLLNDKDKTIADLNKAIGSSTTFDMNKLSYDNSIELTSEVNRIINDTWDAVARKIVASQNESVEIGRKGVIVKSDNEPNKYIVLQHGQIALTQDNGNTWKTAIRPDGVVAERLTGVIVAGVNLIIDSSDTEGNKTFTVDSTGVKIRGQSLTIEGGLHPDQLDPSFKDSLVEFNRTYSNGILMDSTNGIIVTRSDDKVKTILNATEGIKISQNTGTASNPNWKDRFYVDTNGGLVAEGLTAKSLKIQDAAGNVLIDANTGTLNVSNFNVNGTFSTTNIPNLSASKITSGTINADTINVTNINAGNLKQGTTLDGDRVNITNLDASNIKTGTLSSVIINVSTDVNVGRTLYLNSTEDTQLQFKSQAKIMSNGLAGLKISAQNTNITDGNVFLGTYGSVYTTAIRGNLDLSLANIDWGSNGAVAKFG